MLLLSNSISDITFFSQTQNWITTLVFFAYRDFCSQIQLKTLGRFRCRLIREIFFFSQIVTFFDFLIFTGKKQGRPLTWDSWFGSNVELSGLVMDFISSPKDLYNVAMINKVTMRALTTTMVVRCAMFGGTRQYKCIQMLQKLMAKHSIYPPSPLRLIRLVNGKRCEFCNNESPRRQNDLHRYFNTTKAIQCGPFRITENPKPRQIRGSLGLFACYPCMTQVRHRSISGRWSYPCLTRRWHKMFLSASLEKRVHTKQTWSVNRELMHRIFSHPYES